MRVRTSKKQFTTQSMINASALLGITFLASACGSQQYANIATTQQVAAAGALQISPKADVVLVEDDTGDMLDGDYSQITTQVQNMMSTLESENWNYHFTTLRMTQIANVAQAVSSKQDPNWGSLWVSPYPGAVKGAYGTNEDALNPSIFSTFTETPGFNLYSGFVQYNEISNAQSGSQPGLYSTLMNFKNSFANTGFIRPDALLSVIFVGMGNDTSHVNQCWNGNQQMSCDEVSGVPTCTQAQMLAIPAGGQSFPKGNAGACASGAVSLSYFEQQVESMKSSVNQLKIYSAVANSNTFTSGAYCQDGFATPGLRYQQFASDLGGQTYDICSQSLSSILSDVAQNLTSTALDYIQGYILLSTATQEQSAPNTSTIVVTKYPGGIASAGEVIPESATNGWSYAGNVTEDTIVSPVSMNQETGYMIKLNGSAQLSGADYATVTYKMANGQSGN